MLLPALAVAADALARNRRYAVAIAASVFVIGVPRNLNDAVTQQDALSHFQNEVREVLLPIAHDPRAATVPPSLRPEPVTADPVTVGWLLHTAAQHRLPVPKPPIDYHGADFRLAFDLQQRSVPNEHCTSVRTSFSPTLRQGDVLSVSADGLVIAPQPRQQLFKDLYLFFPAQPGKTIVVLHDPGPVHITPPPRHRHEARVCIQHNGG
jgi:hypothetical protein